MRDGVKCLYCEHLGLLTKTTGTCSKDKQTKKLSEDRDCKKYKLAPIHNVAWRKKEIKK